MMKILSTLLLFFIFTVYNTCKAQVIDRDYLKSIITSTIKKQLALPDDIKVNIDVMPIDPRITLQNCQSPLKIDIPNIKFGRNINIKVLCSDDKSWFLYVPTRVNKIIPVLVTSKTLMKGDIITESNTELIYKNSLQIRGSIFSDINIIDGARSKRNLSKGKALTNKNTCWICKGQPVTIIAKTQGLEIKSSGVALQDGYLGKIISVKNSKSGRIIRGKVNTVNQVIIHL